MCHTYRWVNKTWKYMLKNNNVVRCTWLATRSRKKIGALPQLWFHLHSAAKSLQSCPTLCDTIDSSPPGSPVPGILQARTLEWVAISFSNAWKWKVKVKSLSCAWLFETPWTAAYQAPPSMGFSSQEYWSGVPWPSPISTIEVAIIPVFCDNHLLVSFYSVISYVSIPK